MARWWKMALRPVINMDDVFGDFLVRASLAGLGVALIAGPLGAFVVWRRMAFFGSTLAHSALMGVALGLLFDWDPVVGVVLLCAIVSIALAILRTRSRLADDTLLGILAHGTLAIGLIGVTFLETVRFDLMGYLFGDILAVTTSDLIWIYGGGVAVLAVLIAIWRPLLAITVHEELARAEGVRVTEINLLFMLLMALVVAGRHENRRHPAGGCVTDYSRRGGASVFREHPSRWQALPPWWGWYRWRPGLGDRLASIRRPAPRSF